MLTAVSIAAAIIFIILRLLVTEEGIKQEVNENIAIALIALAFVRLYRFLTLHQPSNQNKANG